MSAAPDRIGSLLREWRSQLRTVRRHPLRAPEDFPYQPVGVAYFFVVALGSIGFLAWLSDGLAMTGFAATVAAVAIATDYAKVRVVPERETSFNELFWIVPFMFVPVSVAATMILAIVVVDPSLQPHSLYRTMARLSSILATRMSALAGVVLGQQLVPSDQWWSYAAIAAVALAVERINDYVLFPISLRLGVGPEFSLREYLAEAADGDRYYLAIELPVIAVAATAFPHAPWLIVALAVPYFAIWRLMVLRESINELRTADELRRRVLSMASHELRTPLTTISGFATTLHDRWDEFDDDQRRAYIGIVEQQAGRLARMIDQLLTMTRIEAGVLHPVARRVELAPLIARASMAAGIDLDDVACDTGLSVEADPDHLEQVVINLLTNAHRYGARPIVARAAPAGDDVELRIVDHGPGVPPDFRDRLFEQFTQASAGNARHVGGMGIGLSIVQRLVEAQGGTVTHEPVEPSGACFAVRLPRGGAAAD